MAEAAAAGADMVECRLDYIDHLAATDLDALLREEGGRQRNPFLWI